MCDVACISLVDLWISDIYDHGHSHLGFLATYKARDLFMTPTTRSSRLMLWKKSIQRMRPCEASTVLHTEAAVATNSAKSHTKSHTTLAVFFSSSQWRIRRSWIPAWGLQQLRGKSSTFARGVAIGGGTLRFPWNHAKITETKETTEASRNFVGFHRSWKERKCQTTQGGNELCFHPLEILQFSRTAGEEEEVKVQMEPPVEAKVGWRKISSWQPLRPRLPVKNMICK